MRKTDLRKAAAALVLMILLAAGAGCGTSPAEPEDLILATTTSTMDSGILDVLIPAFEAKHNYRVKPLSVGTGQALKHGEQGEADVLLTHAPAAEEPLVESGAIFNRQLVMHNDFVIAGPVDDPAAVKGLAEPSEALRLIAESENVFVSRGDDSGTHKKEKDLWATAEITPAGDWYLEAGAGMGQTLLIASEKGGYTLTDRATYLANKENLHLDILVEGHGSLLNIYHVMQVSPENHPTEVAEKINTVGAEAFVEFMVSEEAQGIIDTFGVEEYGQPLFFPDAGKNPEELGL